MAKRVKVVLTESITTLGRDGDVVEVEIEKIGLLSNPVKAI